MHNLADTEKINYSFSVVYAKTTLLNLSDILSLFESQILERDITNLQMFKTNHQ
jgi:hypothetical protein